MKPVPGKAQYYRQRFMNNQGPCPALGYRTTWGLEGRTAETPGQGMRMVGGSWWGGQISCPQASAKTTQTPSISSGLHIPSPLLLGRPSLSSL